MIYLRFAGAAAALVWGLCTAFRPRVPLYYKIVFFGMASCFLGSCYEALARLLEPSAAEGFHVGYFGYIGLFFFLYSSYYGAINSLADGGGREFRRYRLIAGLAAALIGASGLCGAWLASEQHVLLTIFILPVTMAAYFAAKLLIMPDVELGIIAAMRPFNALVLFSLPIIVGNLFQQTYTMADSAIVGRYVGEQALAQVTADEAGPAGNQYSFSHVACVLIRPFYARTVPKHPPKTDNGGRLAGDGRRKKLRHGLKPCGFSIPSARTSPCKRRTRTDSTRPERARTLPARLP